MGANFSSKYTGKKSSIESFFNFHNTMGSLGTQQLNKIITALRQLTDRSQYLFTLYMYIIALITLEKNYTISLQ